MFYLIFDILNISIAFLNEIIFEVLYKALTLPAL